MNILIFNWRDLQNPSSGGAEILTHEIAKRWVAWGNQVTQFSGSFKNCIEKEIVDGVTIIRAGHSDARYSFTSVHFLAYVSYHKFFKKKFDVVIDEIHGLPFFTPWYVEERKIALICEVARELWKKMYGPVFGLLGESAEKLYLRTIYKNVPFLTISESTKKDLMQNGIKENTITVLPMGITKPAKTNSLLKEKQPTLLFVGRLSKPKGVEDAIVAISEINKEIPNARLWIVGRGQEEYVKQLQELTKQLAIESNIIFFSYVTEEEKFNLMARAHLLLHPSIREGFGLTIPEAGFVGTPTIAYNSPGIRDIVKNGHNGVLLNYNKPTLLARETIYVLRKKSFYAKLCEGAKRDSRQYSWDSTARVALSCLERLN